MIVDPFNPFSYSSIISWKMFYYFKFVNSYIAYSSNYSIKNTRDIQVLWLVHFKGCTLYLSYVK